MQPRHQPAARREAAHWVFEMTPSLAHGLYGPARNAHGLSLGECCCQNHVRLSHFSSSSLFAASIIFCIAPEPIIASTI